MHSVTRLSASRHSDSVVTDDLLCYCERCACQRTSGLEDKVHKAENGCWIWRHQGNKDFKVRLGVRKFMTVQRYAWTVLNGPLDQDTFVSNSCSEGWCCSPDHLVVKGRGSNYAENISPKRTLTDDQVIEVRRLFHTVGATTASIRACLGLKMGKSAVLGICRGDSYKNIPMPPKHQKGDPRITPGVSLEQELARYPRLKITRVRIQMDVDSYLARNKDKVIQRITAHCAKSENGCLIWQGPAQRGQAKAFFNGQNRTAARAMWTAHCGDPGKTIVRQKCGDSLCCNIDHLYLGVRMGVQLEARDLNQKIAEFQGIQAQA